MNISASFTQNLHATTPSEYVNSFANELSEEGRVAVAPTDIKYNAKHDLIILFKSSINSIDTYSANGKLNKLYSFSDFNNLSEDNVFSPDYFYYYSVKTREDIVYGLYLGAGRDVIAMQELFLEVYQM